MWQSLLEMLGRGSPLSGDSFTQLSCNGTPGVYKSFSPKTPSGQINGIFYFLHYIARMN